MTASGRAAEAQHFHATFLAKVLEGVGVIIGVAELHETASKIGVRLQEHIHRNHRRFVKLAERDEDLLRGEFVLLGVDLAIQASATACAASPVVAFETDPQS